MSDQTLKLIDGVLTWFPMVFAAFVAAAFLGLIALAAVRFIRQRRVQRILASRPPGHFVFAKIMDAVLPMERGGKYEKPLNEALQSRGFGIVTGGGTQMSADNTVAWVGLDLELSNLNEALEFTREQLRKLGAPRGSVLEYRAGEQRLSLEIT